MAIPDGQLEEAKCLLHALEDRVPAEAREQLKLSHRTEGNSIVLFEHRRGLLEPDEWHEEPVAKFTYVAWSGIWKLSWMGQTLRWRSYQQLPQALTFRELFEEVSSDPCCCFFG